MNNIDKRTNKLNALKQTLDSSDVNLQELQKEVARLQNLAALFKRPGKKDQAYIEDLKQFAGRLNEAILVADIESTASTVANSVVAPKVETAEVRESMNSILEQVVLREAVTQVASTLADNLPISGVKSLEERQSQNVVSTQPVSEVSSTNLTTNVDVKPSSTSLPPAPLPSPELYNQWFSSSKSDTEFSDLGLDNRSGTLAVQEDPTTYFETIKNVFYELYQSFWELMDYLTPTCFKSVEQKTEENSALRNYSILSSSSSSTSGAVDNNGAFRLVPLTEDMP
ncbi:MAG: hypothetical protein P1U36_01135 [Legionellaceae bacterium]|nr:hypothetical protein [Legionellaceae bacterium]